MKGNLKKLKHQNPKYPKAYKIGYQTFYGRNFRINETVLIPRPETEQIIDAALNLAGKPYLPGVKPAPCALPPAPIILDVGTGSGCIAITLALELPKAKILAIDSSPLALKTALKNADKFGLKKKNLKIFSSNLLKNPVFHPKKATAIMAKVPNLLIPNHSHIDLIVANLPYVDKNWSWLDKEALNFEPAAALYADDHGLKLIKELLDQSATLRVPYLIIEADPSQHEAVINYAKKAGFHHLKTHGFALTLSTLPTSH